MEPLLVVPSEQHVVLRITGEDRTSWLNGLLTCDVAKVKVGEAGYGLAVTQKGRILADVLVVPTPDAIMAVVPKAAVESLLASFDRYLVMEDAEVKAHDSDVTFAHGNGAAALLAKAQSAGLLAVPFDPTGQGGCVIVQPPREDVVRMTSELGGRVASPEAWEAVRLEHALPEFGRDFDGTTYPQEAALETRAVSFDKGCYLGQEVVCMLEMRGHVKRKLVSMIVDGAVPHSGDIVRDAQGAEIGKITSAATSTTLGKPIALGMVKHTHTDPNTELSINDAKARVVLRPLP